MAIKRIQTGQLGTTWLVIFKEKDTNCVKAVEIRLPYSITDELYIERLAREEIEDVRCYPDCLHELVSIEIKSNKAHE